MGVPRWWRGLTHDGKVNIVVATTIAVLGAALTVAMAGSGAGTSPERAMVGASTDANPTSETSSAVETPAIRRQGSVGLADTTIGGRAISLNAPKADLRWGEGATSEIAFDAVSLNFGNIRFNGADILLLPAGQTASYESCSGATAYGSGSQIDPDTMEGPNACIRTSDGRFAAVRVTSQTDDRITLAITVWELA